MATNWLQNFNQITVSVEMRGINAQKVYYKCILLLSVKYLSWSGNDKHCHRAKRFLKNLIPQIDLETFVFKV